MNYLNPTEAEPASMLQELDLQHIQRCRTALTRAVERGRSAKWTLYLWGRFIKARDSYRCVCCCSTEKIQAHHIIRKTLLPWSAFDPGNGITLCQGCHNSVHAQFNGRPDLSLPLNAENGDDQDEWAFLFGLLCEDAAHRNLDENAFYYLSDYMLEFSVRIQGYEDLLDPVMSGSISRIRFAHEIWKPMPQSYYQNFLAKMIALNLQS